MKKILLFFALVLISYSVFSQGTSITPNFDKSPTKTTAFYSFHFQESSPETQHKVGVSFGEKFGIKYEHSSSSIILRNLFDLAHIPANQYKLEGTIPDDIFYDLNLAVTYDKEVQHIVKDIIKRIGFLMDYSYSVEKEKQDIWYLEVADEEKWKMAIKDNPKDKSINQRILAKDVAYLTGCYISLKELDWELPHDIVIPRTNDIEKVIERLEYRYGISLAKKREKVNVHVITF